MNGVKADAQHYRKEIERQHYDSMALKYSPGKRFGSDAMIPACRAPYLFIEEYLKKDPDIHNKSVIDYACGSGFFSVYLAKLGMRKVVGVDISRESVNCGRKYALIHKVDNNCEFKVGDCERLEFNDNEFDYLVSLGNLSCLDLDVAVREMARVLNRNGIALILDTLGHNQLLNFNRKIKLFLGKKTKYHVEHVLKMDDMKVFDKYFYSVNIKYFDLTTICLYPFGYIGEKFTSHISRLLAMFDQRILSIDFLKPLAYKFVAILSNPRKDKIF